MDFVEITVATIVSCVTIWTLITFNQPIIKFFIALMEDAERINNDLAKPRAIKTWHLAFNFLVVIGLILIDAYYLFMNHKLDAYSSGAIIIAVTIMLYLQIKKNQANKWEFENLHTPSNIERIRAKKISIC